MKQQVGESYNKEPMAIRQKWHEWSFRHDYPPMPNIGTMIEFLDEHSETNWQIWLHRPYYDVRTRMSEEEDYKELADALWEAVKKVLLSPKQSAQKREEER